MRNVFVTAIGTDCGKTVVSAILARAWGYEYWKPIQSGEPTDSDTFRNLTNNKIKIHPEVYKFKTPASPHYAAEVEERNIDLSEIALPETVNPLIIEGAGGLMVPLNDQHLMIDLIKKLNCDIVLVSNLYLGSINHTLLSLEALERWGIKTDYIVFNGLKTPSTESIIQNFSNVPLLFRLNQEQKINSYTIDKYAQQIPDRRR